MARIDAKTYTHFARLLRTEENKFLDLHKPTCSLGNINISPYQLYIELGLHLHVYSYYLPRLAKKLWEKQYGIRLENFSNQWAAKRQIKRAYLPVMISIRKSKLRELKKIVNQSIYEKVLYEAINARDKRAIRYFNTLASDLRLKIIPVKIPRESKDWRDYHQSSKLKMQENLENNLILNNSHFSIYENGKLRRPKDDKGYGQFCANCGIEFNSVVYKNNSLFYRKNISDKKLIRMRMYQNYFLCSKNCYDALRIS